MKVTTLLTFLFLATVSQLVGAGSGSAGELSRDSNEALEKTTALLTTPSQRNEALQSDSKALEADQNVRKFLGSDKNTEEFYKLASEIFKDQVNKGNGDVKNLNNQMDEAKANPEAFGSSLSNEQLKQLRDLASKVEEKQSKIISPIR